MVDYKKDSNNSEHSLVSVIVPVYNVEKYLQRCIDSIVNQSYKNLEIIIVDDGSTDSSGKLCDEISKTDKRIKVIHQQNQGLGAARNSGLKIATGEFISFIDSDDWVEPEMIAAMVRFAHQESLDVVECAIIRSTDLEDTSIENINFVIESREQALERIIKDAKFSVWRRVYTSKILKGMSFMENKIYEDVPFTTDVLNKVDQIGYIDYPFYIYFVEGTSIIRSKYNLKKLNSIDAVLYAKKNTKNYNDKTLAYVNKLVLNFLQLNYTSLFIHSELDQELIHRKKIKKLIEKEIPRKFWTFQAFLIWLLPIRVYSIYMKIKSLKSKN